ncbi:hypothetical protein HOD38_05005 [archaeon]|nr:hypothetical protein [archaeon]MBT4397599.1 hypothetical protein [archaeon]
MKTKIITIFMVLLLSVFIFGCSGETATSEEGVQLSVDEFELNEENLYDYVPYFDWEEYSPIAFGSDYVSVTAQYLISDPEEETRQEVDTQFADWEFISEQDINEIREYRKDFEEEGIYIEARWIKMDTIDKGVATYGFYSL